ncbi:uncharacterized protein LOC130745759 [Lotus japonicus]|uniref:uncharacterized protein LOC130745759 n=1 Tax=Lotus japonicus TaxID=34305 RepID=UPI0025908A4C|nr:uncharacterized protein LOC130745759 [Lotus japonicus]XP_057454114.1 uncharacterized protein LOC130745759 [Lotus japonicus]
MSADIDIQFLPEECWECVLTFLNKQKYHHYMESVSLVSKQFLSITNRIRSTLAISDHTLPFLPLLLHRFPNLTSLEFTHFYDFLDTVLFQISRYPLRRLTSLNISHRAPFPTDGLRALAENTKTLTSLNCSDMDYLSYYDFLFITNSFPFLEELDISHLKSRGIEPLPKLLRKVNLSGGSFITDAELISACKNCKFLEELVIFQCPLLTQRGIASAIRQRPGLRSFSVELTKSVIVTKSFIGSLVSLKNLTCLDFKDSCISDKLLCSVAEEGLPLRKLVLNRCRNYTYSGILYLLSRCQFVQHLGLQYAEFLNDQLLTELSIFLGSLISIDIRRCGILTDSPLFALIRNCPLLNEIKLEGTDIGKKKVKYSNSFMNCFVNPQVKSLHLAWNPSLRDESIKMLSSICPNLQMLDLNYSGGNQISEAVVGVLRRCCKMRHLILGYHSRVKLHQMNFDVPNLEVLSFASSGIDNQTLSVVSKNFCGLLYLDLYNCRSVTTKGVREIVENCKNLREINLSHCYKVNGSVVAWMVSSRPSLRKIVPPPDFKRSASQSELFLRHGCRVCW